jgi:hypothetical protein
MDTKISKQTRRELLEALRERYRNASKIERTQILDEFVDIAGCHRKYAIYLLTGLDPVMSRAPELARKIYSEAVRQTLVVLWEAADRICGKRLKAVLPGLIAAMERHGHLALDPNVRQLLLTVSPATIDRLLAPIRGTAGHRRKRKPTTKSSREIPVRTFADWKEPAPGFLEVDFVAHGGDSMQGTFLHQIREGQAVLAALGSGDLSHGPERQSLEEFLAKLPELWREGEVRPTHRNASSARRTWRTRKDPFDEVWPEILVWLQDDPDSTAKSLMGRLHQVYPGRFPDGQLRTLQRRIREWRRVMARTLVGVCRASNEPTGNALVIGTEREARREGTNPGAIHQTGEDVRWDSSETSDTTTF